MSRHDEDDARPLTIGRPLAPDRRRLAALVDGVLDSDRFTNGGPLHHQLETRLSALFGQIPVRLTSSGTAALMLALRAAPLEAGAEVITTPLSFAASAQAIEWAGFAPVFVDVDPVSLTIDPAAVAAAITPRTAAILAVHFLGAACDVTALAAIADRSSLWLAYDAAHVFERAIGPHSIGSCGDVTAYSLHATKLFHTGEGGALTSTHSWVHDRVEAMRNFGMDAGRPVLPGLNAKLSEFHAAIGLVLLDQLDEELDGRRRARHAYNLALGGLAGVEVVAPDTTAPSASYYAIRLRPADRQRLTDLMSAHAITARTSFPLLCGPGTRFAGPAASALVHAETAAQELVALPFDGRLTNDDVDRVVALVADSVEPSRARS